MPPGITRGRTRGIGRPAFPGAHPDKGRGCDAGCMRLLSSYKSRWHQGEKPTLILDEAGGGDLLVFKARKTVCNYENGKVA